MRWDKLLGGFAQGVPQGIEVATGIERNRASRERTKRERDKLLDDLKTAAQRREIAAAEEGRAVAAEGRAVDLHPLEMDSKRATTETSRAYAESARTSADVARQRAAREAEEAKRAADERKAAARGRGALADMQLGGQQRPEDRRRPNTEPAPVVAPFADPEEFVRARAASLQRRTDEELEAALDPRAILPLHQEREAVNEYLRDPNADPQIAQQMQAQLLNDLEQQYDLISDAAIDAVMEGDNAKVQQLITKMGMLHPNQNMQMVGRLSPDGETVEVGIVQRGTDMEDFQGYRYPISKLPRVLADYKNMLYQDMTLTDSRAAEAQQVTGALESGARVRKAMAEATQEERKASGAGGALTTAQIQAETKQYLPLLESIAMPLLLNAGVKNPEQAGNEIIRMARQLDLEEGYAPGSSLDTIQLATEAYLRRNAPRAAIGQ